MSHIYHNYVTRDFNKIAIQGKGLDGKWTRNPLAYRESNIFNLCIICPPEIYLSTLFLNVFMLLAVTQPVDKLFHSLIVLCEIYYPIYTDSLLMLPHELEPFNQIVSTN